MAVLVVVGLRRSGTTALWRAFRSLPGFSGIYEPFNPKLGRANVVDRKDVWADLRALVGDDAAFADRFAAIAPADEAASDLPPANAGYLAWLLGQAKSPNLVLSIVRCGFKLRDLRAVIGPSTLLHISREPLGWIRSHLHPTEPGLSYARQRLSSRLPVLRDRTMPRDYALDAVVASPPFQARLAAAGIASTTFGRLTAAQRLYVLWLLHERQVETDGPAAWPGDYKAVSHAEFARAPEEVLRASLALAGVTVDDAAIRAATAHVREFDAYRPPAGVVRRIARDVAALNADPAIDTAWSRSLADLHGSINAA